MDAKPSYRSDVKYAELVHDFGGCKGKMERVG